MVLRCGGRAESAPELRPGKSAAPRDAVPPEVEEDMFGSIGGPELLVIFVIALLIFGPKKLSELGRTLGKGVAEFRKAATDLRDTLDAEVARSESAPPNDKKKLPADPAGQQPPAAATDATTRDERT